jgi:antibiotic biosynthesis monooxygenase (ABM) superfamily enzyme
MHEKLKTVATTWVAVYPTITALLLALEPLISDWPLALRTLVLSAVMVPVMVLWAMPFAASQLNVLANGRITRRTRSGNSLPAASGKARGGRKLGHDS